jgi:hypothetical protein
MVLIRFDNEKDKDKALEALVGEHPFTSWITGEMLVPEKALSRLVEEDIPFRFEGSAAYEKMASLRDPVTSPV